MKMLGANEAMLTTSPFTFDLISFDVLVIAK